jgi:hypothetical protein
MNRLLFSLLQFKGLGQRRVLFDRPTCRKVNLDFDDCLILSRDHVQRGQKEGKGTEETNGNQQETKGDSKRREESNRDQSQEQQRDKKDQKNWKKKKRKSCLPLPFPLYPFSPWQCFRWLKIYWIPLD